jgi:hypothetical protein
LFIWTFETQVMAKRRVGNRPNLLDYRWRATYHWKALDEGCNFALNRILIRGLLAKLWGSKVARVPTWAISRLPLGSPETKSHLDVGPVERCKVSLLEIRHFATVLCNWFPVACDTCNWKFAQLRTTSCMKFAVAFDSRIIQVHTVGLYGFIHPYSILAVGRATACNYRGCVHTALHVN